MEQVQGCTGQERQEGAAAAALAQEVHEGCLVVGPRLVQAWEQGKGMRIQPSSQTCPWSSTAPPFEVAAAAAAAVGQCLPVNLPSPLAAPTFPA